MRADRRSRAHGPTSCSGKQLLERVGARCDVVETAHDAKVRISRDQRRCLVRQRRRGEDRIEGAKLAMLLEETQAALEVTSLDDKQR